MASARGGGATGATGTVREYIYLHEAEIAPTFGSRTTVDRPIGAVEGVNRVSPALWFVPCGLRSAAPSRRSKSQASTSTT